ARAVLVELILHRLDQRQAADPRAEIDADLFRVRFRHRNAAVAPGLQPCRHAVVDKQIHAPRLLRRHVRRDVEVLHLARDLACKARRIEARDARDSGGTGERLVPGFLDAVTEGTDDAEAGDDDSAAAHLWG